jgi:hypothetical protein
MSKVLLGFCSGKDNGRFVQVARSLGKFSDDYKDNSPASGRSWRRL